MYAFWHQKHNHYLARYISQYMTNTAQGESGGRESAHLHATHRMVRFRGNSVLIDPRVKQGRLVTSKQYRHVDIGYNRPTLALLVYIHPRVSTFDNSRVPLIPTVSRDSPILSSILLLVYLPLLDQFLLSPCVLLISAPNTIIHDPQCSSSSPSCSASTCSSVLSSAFSSSQTPPARFPCGRATTTSSSGLASAVSWSRTDYPKMRPVRVTARRDSLLSYTRSHSLLTLVICSLGPTRRGWRAVSVLTSHLCRSTYRGVPFPTCFDILILMCNITATTELKT